MEVEFLIWKQRRWKINFQKQLQDGSSEWMSCTWRVFLRTALFSKTVFKIFSTCVQLDPSRCIENIVIISSDLVWLTEGKTTNAGVEITRDWRKLLAGKENFCVVPNLVYFLQRPKGKNNSWKLKRYRAWLLRLLLSWCIRDKYL